MNIIQIRKFKFFNIDQYRPIINSQFKELKINDIRTVLYLLI